MELDEKTVKKVAEVARLNLTQEELNQYSKDLTNILEAFKELGKVKTDGVHPTFQPVEVKDVFRDDVVEPSLSQEQALSNIKKNKEDGCFKAPKVV